MRLALYTLFMQLVHIAACNKELKGYRCRHEMHGDVKECGP